MITPFQKITDTARLALLGGTFAIFIAAWCALHVYNPVIPTPAGVARAWLALGQKGLLFRLWESYTLNLLALAVSAAISCGLAYLSVIAGFTPTAKFISVLRFLGFTGLTYVFGMYWSGRPLQIVLLVFGISTFFTTSMLAVVESVEQRYLDHARTLRLGPWQTLWEVIIRGGLADTLDVLRQNAAIGWVMLTFVEGSVRSQGGIGVLLIDLNRRLLLDGILAVVVTILLIGVVQDFALDQFRRAVCPYTQK